MTTSVIDGSLHASSFPATYTGPGTLIGNVKNSLNGDSCIYGNFTSNGNAVEILSGFPPRKVTIVNTTDGITWYWQYGMPAANSVKTTLGGSFASVQDTGSAITVAGDAATPQNSNVANVTLSATLCGTGKNICFALEG